MNHARVGFFVIEHSIEHRLRLLQDTTQISLRFDTSSPRTLTLPSLCTMLSPIGRLIQSSGWSTTTSCLSQASGIMINAFNERSKQVWTHSGNLPLHLATYTLPTRPLKNSCVNSFARTADVGRIISPDVNLSNRFTAAKKDFSSMMTRQ